MSLEAHLEILYLYFLLEKKKYTDLVSCGVPRSRVFMGRGEGAGSSPRPAQVHVGLCCLALELGFPEINPWALGDRSQARPGVRLARGAGQGLGGA